MQQNKSTNIGRTLFTLDKIPRDNQIRALLDPVPADFLSPVFDRTFQMMQETHAVDKFRSFNNDLLIPSQRCFVRCGRTRQQQGDPTCQRVYPTAGWKREAGL